MRAVLHRSVNHGARCFSHLFGFVDVRLVVAFSTPASVASSIKKFSTFLDRSSLFSLLSFSIVWNFASNSGVEVCYFHFDALCPYSFRQLPSIHRYEVVSCSFPRSAFAVSWMADSTLSGFSGVCGLAGPIGKVTKSRSWSVMLHAFMGVCLTCMDALEHKK